MNLIQFHKDLAHSLGVVPQDLTVGIQKSDQLADVIVTWVNSGNHVSVSLPVQVIVDTAYPQLVLTITSELNRMSNLC